jgi:hypothetical protein
MNPQSAEHACFLRKALMGNALFSTLSGLTILFNSVCTGMGIKDFRSLQGC